MGGGRWSNGGQGLLGSSHAAALSNIQPPSLTCLSSMRTDRLAMPRGL